MEVLELYLYEQVLQISLCVVLGYFSQKLCSEKDVSAALLALLHPAAATGVLLFHSSYRIRSS